MTSHRLLSDLNRLSAPVRRDVLAGIDLIAPCVPLIPRYWDGRKAILEMKSNDFPQWRQMEWPGFYLEYLSKELLEPIFGQPSEKFGNTRFDGFLGVPWDLKCKGLRDVEGKPSTTMYLNDEEATRVALSKFGLLLLVVVSGDYDFDDADHSFYRWHEELKGGKSAYQLSDPGRRHRMRKSAFAPSQLGVYAFEESDLSASSSALSLRSQGKNSNGRPRPRKWLLDIAKVEPAYTIDIG